MDACPADSALVTQDRRSRLFGTAAAVSEYIRGWDRAAWRRASISLAIVWLALLPAGYLIHGLWGLFVAAAVVGVTFAVAIQLNSEWNAEDPVARGVVRFVITTGCSASIAIIGLLASAILLVLLWGQSFSAGDPPIVFGNSPMEQLVLVAIFAAGFSGAGLLASARRWRWLIMEGFRLPSLGKRTSRFAERLGKATLVLAAYILLGAFAVYALALLDVGQLPSNQIVQSAVFIAAAVAAGFAAGSIAVTWLVVVPSRVHLMVRLLRRLL